jgi:hypothetical protein
VLYSLLIWIHVTKYSRKRTGHPLRFLLYVSSYISSSEFFLATVLLHCLLFGVLGWVSEKHFVTTADVKRGS